MDKTPVSSPFHFSPFCTFSSPFLFISLEVGSLNLAGGLGKHCKLSECVRVEIKHQMHLGAIYMQNSTSDNHMEKGLILLHFKNLVAVVHPCRLGYAFLS